MSETNMPAAEVNASSELELTSYEFSFHVLPTVAEGEVENIVKKIKEMISVFGGEVFDEEKAQRFDLAYDIVKYLEGKNRKFSSAYFGWLRFKMDAVSLVKFTESVDDNKELLRYLLVRLSRVEEQAPFQFHESIADRKVRAVEEDAEVAEEEATEEVAEDTEMEDEKGGAVAKETV